MKVKGVDIVRKRLFLILTIVMMFACAKESNKIKSPNGGIHSDTGYYPKTLAKPSDAEEIKNYHISIDGLEEHTIYAIVTNQLIYHNRDGNVYFTGQKVEISKDFNMNNEVNIEEERKIISFNPKIPIPNEWTEKKEMDKDYSIMESNYIEGVKRNFYAYKMPNEDLIDIATTLRKRKTVGDRSINIWVEDSLWNNQSYVKNKIDKNIVSTLADKFLLDGQNDIYSIITNIYGKEYYEEASSYNELINGGREIDIVLFNIHNYYGYGSVLGYFNAIDLFKSGQGITRYSNESPVFFLDAYSLSDSQELFWNLDDYWPEATVSTLAHEFTHLVTFYQHKVKRGGTMARWMNEMLAILSEDIVSNSIGLRGPRGIIGDDLSAGSGYESRGRLPIANFYNNFPINDYYMSSSLNYSIVYSYGAFLLRNFARSIDGLEFFRDIVWSGENDFEAIEKALERNGYNYSFVDTVEMWGKATLLSREVFNGTELYKLNNGSNGFISGIGENKYKIGSINMFNYSTSPTLYIINSKDIPKLSGASTLLFLLGYKESGNLSFNLTLPNYLRVEFIVLNKDGKYDIKKSGTIDIKQID